MKLVECTSCGSLKDVLSAIDCTIYHYINKRYNSLVYNVECCNDDRLYRDLLRYRRILANRLYDDTYPCLDISLSHIITQASLLALPDDCGRCSDCDAEILPSTTSTSTTTTTTTSTTTTTTAYPIFCSRYRIQVKQGIPVADVTYDFTYFPCIDRAPRITGQITPDQVIDLCCSPGSIVIDPVFDVILLNSICIP